MARSASFRVLGFPVRVDPGFVLYLALIVFINSNQPAFAIRLAVCLAVFTLIHELGHALAARRFDTDTSISLAFLVGWAALNPRRALKRHELALISVAGPLAEIATGVALLVAIGGNPLRTYWGVGNGTDLQRAVWWAGPALGLLNLLPFTPLDGGAIVSQGVDRLAPGRGREAVQIFSVAALGAIIVLGLTNERWYPAIPMALMLGYWNLQAMRRPVDRQPGGAAVIAAAEAERQGWATGTPGSYPAGWVPSPWLRAHRMLAAGDSVGARHLLERSLQQASGSWVPPAGASRNELASLAALLPDDAPVDEPNAGWVFQDVLHQIGQYQRSAAYGARLYGQHRVPELAHQVARSLVQVGDLSTAMLWLQAAYGSEARDPRVLDDPELTPLASWDSFRALRERLDAAAGRG